MRKLVTALLLCGLLSAIIIRNPESDVLDAQAKVALEQAILRAAVYCYAIEGDYPDDVTYLEEKYGVMINHDRYIVDYEVFASNVMPSVVVMFKN